MALRKLPGTRLPPFCTGASKIIWCMWILYTDDDYCGLGLQMISSHEDVWAKFRISLLDENKETALCMETQNIQFFKPGVCVGFSKFVRKDFLLWKSNGLYIGNDLFINCELFYMGTHSPEFKMIKNKGQLEREFAERKFCDVSISVKGQDFLCHTKVLADGSPVLAELFKDRMKGKKHFRVVLSDVCCEVWAEMMHFLYKGYHTPNLNRKVVGVFIASKKYGIMGLKTACEDIIFTRMTVYNAVSTLILANNHGAVALKKRILRFIHSHSKDVIKNPDWKVLKNRYPDLANEVILFIPPTYTIN